MGNYVQTKGGGEGFNLIYMSAIFLGGILNKKSFPFYNGNRTNNLPFWLYGISFLQVCRILCQFDATKFTKGRVNKTKKHCVMPKTLCKS